MIGQEVACRAKRRLGGKSVHFCTQMAQIFDSALANALERAVDGLYP
jgi:hypothetical protein